MDTENGRGHLARNLVANGGLVEAVAARVIAILDERSTAESVATSIAMRGIVEGFGGFMQSVQMQSQGRSDQQGSPAGAQDQGLR